MSLWPDAFRPSSTSEISFNTEQMVKLKKLVQAGDFPHLLVYGPSGAGKRTRISCLLHELYGNGVERLRMERVAYTTPSNKKIELMTVSSNYHIEVNPSDVGIYDRVVIQELIKTVAQTQQLDAAGQRDFKVVVLWEMDRLTKDAQHALRRTMEKYMATCRLILCATSMSRVIPAIRSRCLAVRVPAPSRDTIIEVINETSKKAKTHLPSELVARIADMSDRNLRRALLMAQACTIDDSITPTPDMELELPDWMTFLRELANMMVAEQTPKQIMNVRERLYELLVHGIPCDLIFKHLLGQLVENCDMQLKTKVVSMAALYEHRLHRGGKAIMHLEAFVASFMCMYKKFMEEMVTDLF